MKYTCLYCFCSVESEIEECPHCHNDKKLGKKISDFSDNHNEKFCLIFGADNLEELINNYLINKK
jgi:hypothetical protein